MNSIENSIESRIQELGGKVSLAAKNLDTDEEFKWNAERITNLPASVIKLPILCAAYYWARKGVVSLDDRIPVKAEDRVGGNGVLFEFDEGLMPTLHDLMELMIVLSDNMATNMVMTAIGTDRIKVFLEEAGLREIRCERKMLDPAGMKAGLINCISAGAILRLLEGLYRNTLLYSDDCKDAMGILLRQQCNNKMPVKVIERWDLVFKRSEITIAHKTGDMPGIEHDVGVIFTPETDFVLAVLTEDVDNEKAIQFIQNVAFDFTDYFRTKAKTDSRISQSNEP